MIFFEKFLNKNNVIFISLFFVFMIDNCFSVQSAQENTKKQHKAFNPVKTKQHLEKDVDSFRSSHERWEKICKKYEYAVVQMYTVSRAPDIAVPYKKSDQVGSCGSGFFISKDGFILTNYHVVEDAELCYLQYPSLSGELFKLEFCGGFPAEDIALLKLSDQSLEKIKNKLGVKEVPCIPFGDSDALQQAQELIVLGYPFAEKNLQSSLGIFSGWVRVSGIGECIQTTAAVNHGNSGGPVLDEQGRVVGICCCGPEKNKAEGISYLIPSNAITVVLDQLKEQKILRNPFWGFSYTSTTEYELKALGLSIDSGVFIKQVTKSMLLDKAGLQAGDVLYEINGWPIDRFGYVNVPWSNHLVVLIDVLARLPFYSNVSFSIVHDGVAKRLDVEKVPREPIAIDDKFFWFEKAPAYEVIGGLVVCELSNNLIERWAVVSFLDNSNDIIKYRMLENQLEPRLVISHVIPDSQASQACCFDGSFDRVLKSVNDIPVKTIDDFRKAVLTSVGKPSLKIQTEGGTTILFPVAAIVAEDDELREREGYAQSSLIDELALGLVDLSDNDLKEAIEEPITLHAGA